MIILTEQPLSSTPLMETVACIIPCNQQSKINLNVNSASTILDQWSLSIVVVLLLMPFTNRIAHQIQLLTPTTKIVVPIKLV